MTDLHATQKSKSVKYEELVRTYQITFSVHNIFKRKEYITKASLRTQTGTQISDQINLIFIELGKLESILSKSADEMTPLELWTTFLRYSGDPTKRELLNKVLAQKEELSMAGTILAEISKDEHERAKLMSQRKWETDMTHNYLTGKAEGKAEGKAKGKIKIARKLKKAGIMSNKKIADITELTLSEIEKF